MKKKRADVWLLRMGAGAIVVLTAMACGTDSHQPVGGADGNQTVHATRYAPGLDVTARFVVDHGTDLPRKYVELGGRGRVPFEQYLELEQRARLDRYGVIAPSYYQELSQSRPNALKAAALYFNVPRVELAAARRKLHRPGTREVGRRILRESISSRRRPLERKLARRDIDITSRSTFMPVVFVRASADELLALADMPELSLVTSNEGSRPISTGIPGTAPTRVKEANIWEGFNSDGCFGKNIGIGFIESTQRFALNETHEIFTKLSPDPVTGKPVNYQASPMSCSTASDCDAVEGTGSIANVECRDVGRGPECVPGHPTHVTSTTAYYDTSAGPLSAGRATFWIANKGFAEPDANEKWVACQRDAVTAAYDWFVKNDVRVVNESWECDEELTGFSDDYLRDGIVQDYYSWTAGLVIAKAAGNQGDNGYACPFSLNSLCVGYSDAADNLHHTSWLNRKTSDREEPDVITFGYHPRAAKHDEKFDYYTDGEGTSYAAPTVAAVAGLCQQKKESMGGYFSALGFRVMTLLSGIHGNVTGTRYSTPGLEDASGLVIDHTDGAGQLDASIITHECDVDKGDESDGGEVITGTFDFGQSQNAPDASGYNQPDEKFLAKSWHDPPRGQRIWSKSLNAGQRVRGVLSWNACPPISKNAAPAEVETDFDLALYNATTGQYTMMSQSFFDANEGFDWKIQQDGTYELWVLHAPDATGCSPNYYAVGWWFA